MPVSETRPPHVLILGGTGEAAELAAALVGHLRGAARVTSSLAGRTEQPRPLAGAVRIGGFGGASGLAEYLRREAVDLLIDATHPFAAQISRNARAAADQTGTKRLILARPPWPRHPLDRWIEVDTVARAAQILPKLGRRAFLTVGPGELAPFREAAQMWLLVRMIDPPKVRLDLPAHELVIGRGPFTVAGEAALLRQHSIQVLVAKASGGPQTHAKIVAARELGLPVVMLRRPPIEPGERVDTIAGALAWIEAHLALAADWSRGAS
jgi:precorrin-6A/cobalt-precorrin-6A reductase